MGFKNELRKEMEALQFTYDLMLDNPIFIEEEFEYIEMEIERIKNILSVLKEE